MSEDHAGKRFRIWRIAKNEKERERERTSTTRIDQVARWEDLIGPVTKLVLIIQRLYRPCPTSRALAVARVS